MIVHTLWLQLQRVELVLYIIVMYCDVYCDVYYVMYIVMYTVVH